MPIAGHAHMMHGSLSGVLWNLYSIALKSCRVEVFPTTIRMGDS